MTNTYEKQDRGDSAAYAAYFAGMDRSMRQKVALISSYMPTRGVVADMGSGSGSGSFDLAALYPGLHVVGVDINPVAVSHAAETHRRPNLSFRVGDIAEPIFEVNSLNGIFNSSVLHHVTSFNDFSLQKVYRLLDSQASQLREGGILAIRDFVVPDGPEEILLDLPEADGSSTGEVTELSTAALFETFVRQFRCARFAQGGIPLNRVADGPPGYRRYKTLHRLAAEFVLRKDYRSDWETEILEEYTYFSKQEFEAQCLSRGLRILLSRHIYNPWIVQNRFQGKFRFLSIAGETLPYPPTNYIIVAEKTSGGVMLREHTHNKRAELRFLSYRRLKGPNEGDWDLVCRPHETVDIVPWFRLDGDVYVVCRQGYPRPLCNALDIARPLDLTVVAGYISEPISALVGDSAEKGQIVAKVLSERAGISSDAILNITAGPNFYPSPGGIDEKVQSLFAEISPPGAEILNPRLDSGFSTPGAVRAVNAEQTLRAYQVGGMLDNRLEIEIYTLLQKLKVPAGPWIGPELHRPRQSPEQFVHCSWEESAGGSARQVFTPALGPPAFLEIRRGNFEELDRNGKVLAVKELEYVVPQTMSTNTVSLLVFTQSEGQIFVGLEERDLPVAQLDTGNSRLFTVPAFRLPPTVDEIEIAKIFVQGEMAERFATKVELPVQLGGAYYPSIGITPEVVSVLAAELSALPDNGGGLHWFAARELMAELKEIQDGHLLTALLRLSHALGLAHFFD